MTHEDVGILNLFLGDVVRSRRIASGLSQRDLAKRCNLTRPAVSRLESGRNGPSTVTLLRLSEVFEVSVSTIFADAEARMQRAHRDIGMPAQEYT